MAKSGADSNWGIVLAETPRTTLALSLLVPCHVLHNFPIGPSMILLPSFSDIPIVLALGIR